MDRELLADVVAPVVAFAQRTGHEIYCSQFGVADWVEPTSRRASLADFLGLLREHGIGFGLWSYKAMDFGLVDLRGEGWTPSTSRWGGANRRPDAYSASTATGVRVRVVGVTMPTTVRTAVVMARATIASSGCIQNAAAAKNSADAAR